MHSNSILVNNDLATPVFAVRLESETITAAEADFIKAFYWKSSLVFGNFNIGNYAKV